MLGFLQNWGAAIDFRAWVNEQLRFQDISTFFALIRARIRISTDIAGAFHVTVRQKALLRGRVPLLFRGSIKVTVVFEGRKS